jgi:dolichol-phosphate mannosyltransferase
LGHTTFALRLSALVCGALASLFLFVLARERYGSHAAGWRTAALLNLLPIFLGLGFFAFPDAPLLVGWTGALWFGLRALRTGRALDWLGWGLSTGLAMLSKYYGAALLVGMGLFAVSTPEGRRALRQPWIYLGILVALAVFAPVIWWNAQHDWASFRFQFLRRAESAAAFHSPEFLGYQLLAVTPLLLAVLVAVAWRAGRGADWRDRFLAWQFWPMFSLFALYSLKQSVHLNWVAPAYLSLLPLAQQFISEHWTRSTRAALWSVAGWAAVVLGVLGHLGGGPGAWLPPAAHAALDRRFEWHATAEALEHVEHEIEKQRCREPFFLAADKYYLASLIAYYDDDHDWWDATSRNLLGQFALAWDDWQRPERFVGRDAIIVAENPNRLSDELLRPHFQELSSTATLSVPDERVVYYRIGYRYHR